MSVKDVATAIILAAKTNGSGDCNTNHNVYNIGTGKSLKIKDLAKLMIKTFKLDLEPIFAEQKQGDIMNSYADITKSKDELRFIANENINSALKGQFCKTEKLKMKI